MHRNVHVCVRKCNKIICVSVKRTIKCQYKNLIFLSQNNRNAKNNTCINGNV